MSSRQVTVEIGDRTVRVVAAAAIGPRGPQGEPGEDLTAELAQEVADRTAADLLLVPLTQKGAANGVATLGADSKIPSAQIPAIALSEFLGSVGSQAAMLALVGERGDWCVRTDFDPDRVFILTSDDPTQVANWTDVTTPGSVVSVNGKTGTVVLVAGDIADFAAAVIAAASGTYVPQDLSSLTASSAPDLDDLVYIWLDGAPRKVSLADLQALIDTGGGGTVDVVSNVATSRILGRITAGSGDSEELTAAQVKTLLAIALADITDASANGRSLVSAANYAAMKTLLAIAISDVSGLETALDAKLTLDRTAVKTANYTAAAGDLVPVDTTSGAVTITLPTAPADKSLVAVKHIIQGGSNTVSIACAGSDVFNKAGGSTTATLSYANQAMLLQYDAGSSVWTIVADDLPLSALDLRFQPLDSDLTTWAGLTPSANAQSLVTAANYAAMRTLLGLVVGTDVEAHDADLTTFAGLTPSNDDLLQRKAGAWTNRTPAQVKTDLALVKADVGLGNVDNTSDANKPVSTATQTALDAKAPLHVTETTQTGDYTLALADDGTVIAMNKATAVTVTVPPASSVAFPTGTLIEIYQLGAGQVTIAAGAGVTLRTPNGAKSARQYSTVGLRYRGSDIWVVNGDTLP